MPLPSDPVLLVLNNKSNEILDPIYSETTTGNLKEIDMFQEIDLTLTFLVSNDFSMLCG